MLEEFRPGDRVLDLRAVSRSAGMFADLVTAPVAKAMSGPGWGWWVLASAVAGVAGLAAAAVVGRIAFPAPTGRTRIVPVGRASLGVALAATMAGGAPIVAACAVAAFVAADGIPAVATVLVALTASAGVGCAASLT